MRLQDGEYELDVSGLFDSSNTTNLALRYGFIPDSMDQNQPLKLYQIDNECVLNVKSTDGDEIIFEGIPQRHKSSTIGNDSYYITFDDNNIAHLKKLDSTIRLSKTRNASKLQIKMKNWDQQASQQGEDSELLRLQQQEKLIEKTKKREQEREQERRREAQKQKNKQEEKLKQIARKELDKKLEAKREAQRTKKQITSSKPSVSSKRPPTANNTPDIDVEPIISASDFDNLDLGDFEDEFPVIIIDEDNNDKVNDQRKKLVTKSTEMPEKVITGSRRKVNELTSKPAKKKESSDMDIDDEFKDLEDQLAEVLEEEKVSPPEKSSTFGASPMVSLELDIDSEESDYDNYQFSSIKIDDGTTSRNKTTNFTNPNPTNQKPVSLRKLVENDDISSEEE